MTGQELVLSSGVCVCVFFAGYQGYKGSPWLSQLKALRMGEMEPLGVFVVYASLKGKLGVGLPPASRALASQEMCQLHLQPLVETWAQ